MSKKGVSAAMTADRRVEKNIVAVPTPHNVGQWLEDDDVNDRCAPFNHVEYKSGPYLKTFSLKDALFSECKEMGTGRHKD